MSYDAREDTERDRDETKGKYDRGDCSCPYKEMQGLFGVQSEGLEKALYPVVKMQGQSGHGADIDDRDREMPEAGHNHEIYIRSSKLIHMPVPAG